METLERVQMVVEQAPFMGHLGVRLLDWAPGYGKVALTVAGHHLNARGTAHGGAIIALADGACSVASATVAQAAVGVQVNLNILTSPQEGADLVAEARVIHDGRRSIVIEVTVSDGNGKLVARGTGMGMRLEGGGSPQDRGFRGVPQASPPAAKGKAAGSPSPRAAGSGNSPKATGGTG